MGYLLIGWGPPNVGRDEDRLWSEKNHLRQNEGGSKLWTTPGGGREAGERQAPRKGKAVCTCPEAVGGLFLKAEGEEEWQVRRNGEYGILLGDCAWL